MSDFITLVASTVGGGTVLTVIASGILYVTRNAIVKAVEQAGNRELARLHAELAADLEQKKATFSKELERERQEAARGLEQFKAELSLDAEVRRQVASARVRVLGGLVEEAYAMLRALSDLACAEGQWLPKYEDLLNQCEKYSALVRHNAHIFDMASEEAFRTFGDDFWVAVTSGGSGGTNERFDKMFPRLAAATDKLVVRVRAQLGLLDVPGPASKMETK